MTRYYFFAQHARRLGRKIAWITSGAPVEPLYAMGVVPVYPENHGAICGVARKGVELCEIAEGMGYSPDLCSYAKCDIASLESGKSPIGGLPRPDLLVACSNICGTVVKWYEVLAERLNVPLVVIDTPFLHDGDSGGMAPALTAYVRGQIEELVETLERLTGRELREQRLLEVAERSLGAVRLWKQILGRCASRPSPMTCFDAFIHMAPIVTLRGTESGLRYYRLLDRELERRQQRGEGALAGERFRLLWDNLPIWPAMRFLGETFAGHGACLVADTYTSAWAEARLVPERSLDTLAEAYTSVYLNLGLGDRIARIRGLAERFQADGLVIHSNRSCKPYSFGQYDLARALSEDGRLPCLVLEADMVDPRALSEGAVRSRIEAFVEMLAERQLGQRPASAART